MLPSSPSRSFALASALLVLPLLACEELDDFSTGPNDVFRGEVIGADRDGGMSFIRSGFPPHTLMDLTFDAARASAASAGGQSRRAGRITTYRCPSGATQCDSDERIPGHFDRAGLYTFPNLTNDVLSQYDFPGGGRLRNYMFGTRFVTPGDDQGRPRDAMVFVSLMENGDIEVRVIAQSAIDELGTEVHAPLFGVFPLERRAP